LKNLLFFFLLGFFVGAAGSETAESGPASILDDMDRESLRVSIRRSLDYLARVPRDRMVGKHPRKITAAEVQESLHAFNNLLGLWDKPKISFKELYSHFDLYPSSPDGAESHVLVTGYYQPVIEASLVRTEEFRFPIYGKPEDLIQGEMVTLRPELRVEKIVGRLKDESFVPYPSRDDIDRLGFLGGKGHEIAWVKDPTALFFLHIQGSGLLRLGNGNLYPISYAATNGRPYRSIGKILIESGKITKEELSMRRLRCYLEEHPQERDALFAQNERYIFFRFVEEGPLGSLDVPVTPGRSIATDSTLFPKGAIALLISHKPVFDSAGNLVGWQPFSRFVLNQDTGSAIQGNGRVDLYFGSGKGAGREAGFMKTPGRLYFLFKKETINLNKK
jgi:membrane-bound lytic murein transglycosylase A